MSVERSYEGESPDGILQSALERALQQLAADLTEGGVRDASASWVVTEVAGKLGGWFKPSIIVKIAAKRVPEW
jgi:hypothetical protein